jgi:hypothetical protein
VRKNPVIFGAAVNDVVPFLASGFDAQLIHLPLRYACRRTVPEETAAPLAGLMYLTVTLNEAPVLIDRVLIVVRVAAFFFAAAAAAVTTGAAALAAGVATNWPAQRQRPRDSASVPVPMELRRRRLELCSCTVEISLRHACGVSCRVRAGRLPGRVSGFTPRFVP